MYEITNKWWHIRIDIVLKISEYKNENQVKLWGFYGEKRMEI